MTDDAPEPPLTMHVGDAVATLTFNRPQKSNAYDKRMQRALGTYLMQAAADAAIRVLVLRGEGRHFCAGADLSADAQADASEAPGIAELCYRLATLPKPTLALVQGACLGGGMALVACCDFAIAAAHAFFAMPEARLGFSPTPLIPFLLQAIAAREAQRVLMAGARFGAGEALRIGLVQAVGSQPGAEQMLEQRIGELLQSAPGAIAEIKAAVAQLRHQPITPELLSELQRGFDTEKDSAEFREGRAAAREKRPPSWSIRR
jgi:methylglutaconyl-CoA hydratase